jgi:hypothetical protein
MNDHKNRRPPREGPGGPAWRKSSHSGNNGGQCVEVALHPDGASVRLVRDSKDPSGPLLTFTPDEWRAFIAGVRDGEFDLA